MRTEEPTWVPFLDWNDVFGGHMGYTDDGRQVLQDGASGVRLGVQAAEKSGPFFQRERPWEALSLGFVCILFDEGRYRMWYRASPNADDRGIAAEHKAEADGNVTYTCYAESGDGLQWERPELGLCEYGGSRKNNILFPGNYLGIGSVLCDPSAPESERYKTIHFGTELRIDGERVSAEAFREFWAKVGEDEDAREEARKRARTGHVLQGAVSADGIHWERLAEPLLGPSRWAFDTQNVLVFDAEAGRYAVYVRGRVGVYHYGRRGVRRSCSSDFRRGWSEPELILMAQPDDPVDEDIYTPAYSRYPGGKYHLMFPSIYHRASDVIDIHLAVSRDGLNWVRPGTGPIVDRGAGDEGGRQFGTMYAGPGLLPLGEECWGLAYAANWHNHNEYGALLQSHRPAADGEFWWAKWKRDRLVAVEAPTLGHFSVSQRPCAGKQLLVNCHTERGGWLQFELVDGTYNRKNVEAGPAYAGYSFADCDPLRGDLLAQEVTWRGESDLSALAGKSVLVRVKMVRARLFALAI